MRPVTIQEWPEAAAATDVAPETRAERLDRLRSAEAELLGCPSLWKVKNITDDVFSVQTIHDQHPVLDEQVSLLLRGACDDRRIEPLFHVPHFLQLVVQKLDGGEALCAWVDDMAKKFRIDMLAIELNSDRSNSEFYDYLMKESLQTWEHLVQQLQEIHDAIVYSNRLKDMALSFLVVHLRLIHQGIGLEKLIKPSSDSWFMKHPLFRLPVEGTFNRYGSEGLRLLSNYMSKPDSLDPWLFLRKA